MGRRDSPNRGSRLRDIGMKLPGSAPTISVPRSKVLLRIYAPLIRRDTAVVNDASGNPAMARDGNADLQTNDDRPISLYVRGASTAWQRFARARRPMPPTTSRTRRSGIAWNGTTMLNAIRARGSAYHAIADLDWRRRLGAAARFDSGVTRYLCGVLARVRKHWGEALIAADARGWPARRREKRWKVSARTVGNRSLGNTTKFHL